MLSEYNYELSFNELYVIILVTLSLFSFYKYYYKDMYVLLLWFNAHTNIHKQNTNKF